jgi:hypothetical protein
MRLGGTALAALAMGLSASGTAGAQDQSCAGAGLRLNEIQLIGTHNSYHIEPDPAVAALLERANYKQSDSWPAERLVPAIGYTHAPIDVQLAYGVRHLEIDIYRDPAGGRFADPGAYRALAAQGAAPALPFASAGEMRTPGFKVFHAADFDVRSSCATLIACLRTVGDWSARHRDHMPIVIQLEAKDHASPAIDASYAPADVLSFDAEAFRALDGEIRQVFPVERILMPDTVRGGAPSLNAAIRAQGWPRLADATGRVMFTLGDTRATAAYLQAFPGARGGVLFPSIGADDPDTAWLNIDDPSNPTIEARVREGFLVYVRADTHTKQARKNDTKRRDRAFGGGAQIISTDYPWPDLRYSSYRASFPDAKFVRANPVLTRATCGE